MTGPRIPGKKPRKVRGCYNCSQRRINCDRGAPACQKCIKKGLECLGLGKRYRFNDGVASRGKWSGKSMPVGDIEKHPKKRKQDNPSAGDDSVYKSEENKHDPPWSLDHVDHQARFLLGYFAEKIAPVMVAIDIASNGYRDLILPICDEDTVIRSAVLATAAFHLSIHQTQWKEIAVRYHMAAIRGLNQRTKEDGVGDTIVYSNLSTMIILLIEEMVTGGRDFVILLRMVKSFIASQGGEGEIERHPVGCFLMQQIRKMSLYAEPLLSEESAITTLANVSNRDLDFLYSCMKAHPEHSEAILKLIGLIRKACNIYMCRATSVPAEAITDLVESFINETATFNATSPGGHILVWAFFIVGAECSSERHRSFIMSQLQNLWVWTGFANTLYAIRILQSVWQESENRNWTQVIARNVEVFIM
ncbi:hypothetical protein ASPWEDRAFT_71988 [Aspergillus wentii DTO 134E9]|uniref:Zn(2)-C6 fungal-type domain-containing protein n=1 Tax=Aspergillus wentii DTO 134E9 TaxID=1073089 RepID=A0A1L9R7S9_ASPWE|nr:uncharacterized protein ASPWEDRAFT_71988 [Aspergillus wentii DTO 134E9]KAI9927589.1 hypothetical protein MW887_003208 [Aspergillus wentii]OJJ30964.1 hypothetical protein ASPWEDRAFT_71988 [Aspergillus wentii DTO 134E9]